MNNSPDPPPEKENAPGDESRGAQNTIEVETTLPSGGSQTEARFVCLL